MRATKLERALKLAAKTTNGKRYFFLGKRNKLQRHEQSVNKSA